MQAPFPSQDPLFQRSWWEDRIQGLDQAASMIELTPRPDLSTPERTVSEFHLRTHDGDHLFALLAQPTGAPKPVPARIRCCGPAEPPELDPRAAREGIAEILVQEVAGRRLEDRVLDMVSTFRVARRTPGLDGSRVMSAEGSLPDELRIAQRLSDWKFC